MKTPLRRFLPGRVVLAAGVALVVLTIAAAVGFTRWHTASSPRLPAPSATTAVPSKTADAVEEMRPIQPRHPRALPPREAASPGSDSLDVPFAAYVVNATAGGDSPGFHRVSWRVPTASLSHLIDALEHELPTNRYHAEQSDNAWNVEATFSSNDTSRRDAPSSRDQADRSAFRTALEEIIAATEPREEVSAFSGTSVAGQPAAETPAVSHQRASGFVEFKRHDRMYWLWDDRVLRLERTP